MMRHGVVGRGRRMALAAAALAGILAWPVGAQAARKDIERRIDGLLQRMTLEEKIGEMTQLTIEAVGRTHGTADTLQVIDSAKLEDALLRHHVGSL
ncbi:MAG TPA: hypothetical protein VGG84_00500, partial [Gemmatimonadaceae bacterium]